MEEHPDVKIIVLDSLAASMGEGLFVHKAVRLRDAGKTMEETAEWLRQHVLNVVHVFTVDGFVPSLQRRTGQQNLSSYRYSGSN